MTVVVLSAYHVVTFPQGGGHFWVYLQYALGLRLQGCDVYWLEGIPAASSGAREAAEVEIFRERMREHGMGEKTILYRMPADERRREAPTEYLIMTRRQAEAVFRRADLLLNFHYAISPGLLGQFRRTVLMDIDPGLLQFWISHRQLDVPRHDFHLSSGETVGVPGGGIPSCGLRWMHFRPPVCVERWPYVFRQHSRSFTTVSLWDSSDWLAEGGVLHDNTKRAAFQNYLDLPRRTTQPLELALFLCTRRDRADRRKLEKLGWRVCDAREAAGSPLAYRAYIQRSRGEFSCAKPSCIRFQNAWVSDRTLCYLASGKPVVVQNTGPSSYLPNGEGMFRFSTPGEAADALEAINGDYERHCRAAREIAETHFESKQATRAILNCTLGSPDRPAAGDCGTAPRGERHSRGRAVPSGCRASV